MPYDLLRVAVMAALTLFVYYEARLAGGWHVLALARRVIPAHEPRIAYEGAASGLRWHQEGLSIRYNQASEHRKESITLAWVDRGEPRAFEYFPQESRATFSDPFEESCVITPWSIAKLAAILELARSRHDEVGLSS